MMWRLFGWGIQKRWQRKSTLNSIALSQRWKIMLLHARCKIPVSIFLTQFVHRISLSRSQWLGVTLMLKVMLSSRLFCLFLQKLLMISTRATTTVTRQTWSSMSGGFSSRMNLMSFCLNIWVSWRWLIDSKTNHSKFKGSFPNVSYFCRVLSTLTHCLWMCHEKCFNNIAA